MDSIMSYQSRRFVVIKDKTNHVNNHGIFSSAPMVKEKEQVSSAKNSVAAAVNSSTNANGVGFTLPSLKLNHNSSNNSH